MAPARADGDAGVASGVIAFLIAGVLFMASIVAVVVMTRDQATNPGVDDAPQSAAFVVQADTLADLIFRSPGYIDSTSPYAASDWVSTVGETSRTGKTARADDVARLGLLDTDEDGMLDYKKFQNLRNAPFEEDLPDVAVDCDDADGDGNAATGVDAGDCFVNYVDAKEALGLAASGLDFHLRAYPSLQSVADLIKCSLAGTPCRDPNLQVTYVGDILPPDEEVAVGFTDAQWAELFFPGALEPDVTCTAGVLPKTYRLATTVRNGGSGGVLDGLDEVQLRASFTIDFGTSAGPGMTQNANGYFVDQGGDITFYVDAPAYDGRYCKSDASGTGTTVEVDIKDHDGVLWTFTESLTSTTSGVSTATKDLWLEANDYFLSSEAISVAYKGNNIHKEWARVEIRNCDCTTSAAIAAAPLLRDSGAFKMASNGGDVPFAMLPAGVYTAVIYDGSSASSTVLQVTERIIVIDPADEPLDTFQIPAFTTTTTYTPGGTVEDEVAILESLVEQFCPTYWDVKDATPMFSEATEDASWEEAQWTSRCGTPGFNFKGTGTPWATQPSTSSNHLDYQYGDVFPDSERELREELINRLTSDGSKSGNPIYDYVDVLIIGSGVEHSELASENIKGPIETWVEGGGTLIVLGSEIGKNNNWLNPFLNSGTRSSGGGVSVPDPAHPILHVPDELDYPNYDSGGEVWEFHGSNDANERFTQVVSLGENGEFEPILAISKPGAIRNDDTGTSGTVILTTWVGYDVYRNFDRDPDVPGQYEEGQKFFNNLLMMGYGDLYLDYGPDIPDNTNVVPSIRVGQIRHPDFEDPIEVTVITFVFSG